LPAARLALFGIVTALLVTCGRMPAEAGARGRLPLYVPIRGALGLGFGFGQWWGPPDSYAPPAYGYPPPVYTVPPPDSAADVPPPPTLPKGCREFRSTVIVDGQVRVSHGLACRRPDGTWRIVQ
jgi:hypothetical protein